MAKCPSYACRSGDGGPTWPPVLANNLGDSFHLVLSLGMLTESVCVMKKNTRVAETGREGLGPRWGAISWGTRLMRALSLSSMVFARLFQSLSNLPLETWPIWGLEDGPPCLTAAPSPKRGASSQGGSCGKGQDTGARSREKCAYAGHAHAVHMHTYACAPRRRDMVRSPPAQ